MGIHTSASYLYIEKLPLNQTGQSRFDICDVPLSYTKPVLITAIFPQVIDFEQTPA
jgi:hypothetical protein